MFSAISSAVLNGGTGYILGDIITVSGGTLTAVAQFQVTAVGAGGVVTAVEVHTSGTYDTIPNNPANTTGGTGVGLVLTITWTQSSSPTQPPTFRTTADLVRGIVQVQAGVDLDPFIAIANQMVTDNCTYPQPGVPASQQTPYTDGFVGSKMELIERWLSAHFYSVFSNQLSHAKAGTVAVGFQFKVDLGLKVTLYGQQVMRLDNYGNLAAIDNTASIKRKIKIGITYMGRPPGPCGYVDDWQVATICQ